MLRRLGVGHADSDDLVQEIFFVVHRKLDDYDGSAPFRSWLYGICIRMVSTYRRSWQARRRRLEAFGTFDETDLRIAVDPERCLEMRRACLMLEGLLVHLDDDQRQVFVLFEMEGHPMTEVAEVVGCPLQTAYSRLHAARKSMRALVVRHRFLAESDGARLRQSGS
jgi:RNA polymerase sigma-70 factor (ECF subfamily)